MTNSYILNDTVTFDERLEHEFKGFEKINPRETHIQIHKYASKYINAFLNGEGGTIYLGIENNGKVTGIPLTREQRDDIQKRISQNVGLSYPPVEPKLVSINFMPIHIKDENQKHKTNE